MNNLLIICFIFYLSSYVKGECLAGQFQCKTSGICIPQFAVCNKQNDCADSSDESNCAGGCVVNGTTIPQNTTGQDMEWWYVCTNTKWVLSGCVIHGHRFRGGENYRMFTTEGIFWGTCQQLKNNFFMRQPQGCVDIRGKNVQPGETFMINDVFWGVCLLNQNTTTIPDVGAVALNEISWKVTGCNNGSDTPVKEGEEFPWIFDPYVVLGVKVKCKLPPKAKEMPTLNPTACIVGVNSSGLWEVRILKDHCYMAADDLIFYCAINQRAFGANPPQQNTNHADKSFTLNITNNAPTEVQRLTRDRYRPCFDKDPALTAVANANKANAPPNPNLPPPEVLPPNPNQQPPPVGNGRKRRSLNMNSITNEFEQKMKSSFYGSVRAVSKKMYDFNPKNYILKN